MRQEFVVRLGDEHGKICDKPVDKLKVSRQKAGRARILR